MMEFQIRINEFEKFVYANEMNFIQDISIRKMIRAIPEIISFLSQEKWCILLCPHVQSQIFGNYLFTEFLNLAGEKNFPLENMRWKSRNYY